MRPAVRVFALTDPRWDDARIVEVVAAAHDALGAELAVIVRELGERAPKIAEATRRVAPRATLLVKGDPALAARLDAGEHLGSPPWGPPSRPGILRSGATHGDDDVALAARVALDFVLVSPIFPTPGKGAPRGIEAIARARALAPAASIVALGGVEPTNARAAAEAGADAVAVVRALWDATDPAEAARALASALRRGA